MVDVHVMALNAGLKLQILSRRTGVLQTLQVVMLPVGSFLHKQTLHVKVLVLDLVTLAQNTCQQASQFESTCNLVVLPVHGSHATDAVTGTKQLPAHAQKHKERVHVCLRIFEWPYLQHAMLYAHSECFS